MSVTSRSTIRITATVAVETIFLGVPVWVKREDSDGGSGESGRCVTSGDDGGEMLGTNGRDKGGSGGGSGSDFCSGGNGGGELSKMDFTSCRLQNWNDGCYFFGTLFF